jgi:hypothetical protein
MIRDALALIGGLAITAATVFDVFATVVVPGRVSGPINVSRLLRTYMFGFWRGTLRACAGTRDPRMGSVFGAMLLLMMLVVWVCLTLLGLSLTAWALRRSFTPPITEFGEAAFEIGCAMMTLGLSGHGATGWARPLVVVAGLCGLQIVTVTLSFIVQIQTALRDRDALVLKLESRAGSPPSGVVLLATTRELDAHDGLPKLFDDWESWAAMLLYTHGAHPVLSYFRSDKGGLDWLTAMGAVLDAASVTIAMLGDVPGGNARLMQDGGVRTVRRLCGAFRLDPRAMPELTDRDVANAAARLERAGYAIRRGCGDALRQRQRAYRGELAALVRHFGVEEPAWLGGQDEQAAVYRP